MPVRCVAQLITDWTRYLRVCERLDIVSRPSSLADSLACASSVRSRVTRRRGVRLPPSGRPESSRRRAGASEPLVARLVRLSVLVRSRPSCRAHRHSLWPSAAKKAPLARARLELCPTGEFTAPETAPEHATVATNAIRTGGGGRSTLVACAWRGRSRLRVRSAGLECELELELGLEFGADSERARSAWAEGVHHGKLAPSTSKFERALSTRSTRSRTEAPLRPCCATAKHSTSSFAASARRPRPRPNGAAIGSQPDGIRPPRSSASGTNSRGFTSAAASRRGRRASRGEG